MERSARMRVAPGLGLGIGALNEIGGVAFKKDKASVRRDGSQTGSGRNCGPGCDRRNIAGFSDENIGGSVEIAEVNIPIIEETRGCEVEVFVSNKFAVGS